MSENFKKEVTPYEQAEPQPESVHYQPAAERRAEQEPAEHPEQKEQRAPVLTAACTDAQETGGIGNAFRSLCFSVEKQMKNREYPHKHNIHRQDS